MDPLTLSMSMELMSGRELTSRTRPRDLRASSATASRKSSTPLPAVPVLTRGRGHLVAKAVQGGLHPGEELP